MSNYRYTAGRPVEPNHGYDAVSPLTNSSAYSDEQYNADEQTNAYSREIYNDPNSPFFGMDPQLAGFVQKHNVVMDDGAVVNVTALASKVAQEAKRKKRFQPPCGLTLCQFIGLVVGTSLLVVLLLVALVLGLVFGLRVVIPSYPAAEPWWRRTQMYQINVATWANDVDGPSGRLEDVVPRMAYLSDQIGVTSVVLTELVAHDLNGITDWQGVSSTADMPTEAIHTVIPKLVEAAQHPLGSLRQAPVIHIVLGLPLYATSIRHTWFQQSLRDALSPYGSYYLWTKTEPVTQEQQRYYAYSEVRRAYYRHSHGNPNAPMLNLSYPGVQSDMKNIIQFWRKNLRITGIMITNSTNVIPEIDPSLRTIVDDPSDMQFMWFADDPKVDKRLNSGEKVCFSVLTIKHRVPTRAYDLTDQITESMNDLRLATCTPIWRIEVKTENKKDFETVQKLARFLPGNFLMLTGQEVDLTTGNTELIKWAYTNFNDYTTYWPVNKNLEQTGRRRVAEWRAYQTAVRKASLLGTQTQSNRLVPLNPVGTDDLLAVFREYQANGNRDYFIVSFQTLNTRAPFQSVFDDLNSPLMQVAYDSKGVYHGRRTFFETELVNNQIILLQYY